MLIEIFKDHNQKIAALVGNGFAKGTLRRYEISLRHTEKFLEYKYRMTDIDIKKIDNAFISEYEFYLRSVRKCENNSAVKNLKNFGKIIRICLANGWITGPFRCKPLNHFDNLQVWSVRHTVPPMVFETRPLDEEVNSNYP